MCARSEGSWQGASLRSRWRWPAPPAGGGLVTLGVAKARSAWKIVSVSSSLAANQALRGKARLADGRPLRRRRGGRAQRGGRRSAAVVRRRREEQLHRQVAVRRPVLEGRDRRFRIYGRALSAAEIAALTR
jgi:hypothetical protein